MSTNYYAVTPDTDPGDDGLHIGQSASGWEFLWQAHRDPEIKSVAGWREFLSRPEVTILDEYGREHDLDDFMAWATMRAHQVPDGLHQIRRPRVEVGPMKIVDFRDEAAHGCPFSYIEFC